MGDLTVSVMPVVAAVKPNGCGSEDEFAVIFGGARRSTRQADHGPEAPQRRAGQGDVAAVAAGDVAGDGEAEAHALGVLVAGLVEAAEGLEGFLVLRLGDAGTVIVDGDLDTALGPGGGG